jgi:hypothetical protein
VSLVPGILYFYKSKNIGNYLGDIIYNDSKGFNPKKRKANDYFNFEKITKETVETKETTRELKKDEVTLTCENNQNNILKLKENENENNHACNTNEERDIKMNNFVEENKDKAVAKPEIKINHIISYQDYKMLANDELHFDKRRFFTIFKEMLILDHSLISLLFKKSLFEPSFLRLIKFVFEINTQFTFCALLFTDSYIEDRLKYSHLVINY